MDSPTPSKAFKPGVYDRLRSIAQDAAYVRTVADALPELALVRPSRPLRPSAPSSLRPNLPAGLAAWPRTARPTLAGPLITPDAHQT